MARITSRLAQWAGLTVLVAAAACLGVDVGGPQCIGPIQLQAPDEVVEGESFMVTASHVGDGCLNQLMWVGQGAVKLIEAGTEEAEFQAVEPGTGTIRVSNPHGNQGEVEVDVAPAQDEEGSPARRGGLAARGWDPGPRPAVWRAGVSIPDARAFFL